MEHVVVRKLEHLSGSAARPSLGFAVETRDRPGPAHKAGVYSDDTVWVQLHGGLFIGKARVELGWVGEYSDIREVRARTKGSTVASMKAFWTGRPRYGYAAVARLRSESWIEPFWGGPRTYGYEWVVLDDAKKRSSWLTAREAPRSSEDLSARFAEWLRQQT